MKSLKESLNQSLRSQTATACTTNTRTVSFTKATRLKDRLDKIFIDKYLYCKLTDTCIPHIAIFLNDVQRKAAKGRNRYGINATFLPGHFKGYSIKLNPLDGVYYCDIRPNMQTDPLLSRHIRTIDHFFCGDLWQFVSMPGDRAARVVDETRLP